MEKLLKNKLIITVILIILSGLVLRLWNYHNLFYFAIDEEKGAYIIKGIAEGTHFPTVGHPSSIGFRLGPLLYYLLSPFYKLFGPHPIIWGYISILVSILSMILIWKIGKLISNKTGLISLALYAFSYLTILYDRRGWQVSFHSLIALLTLISLVKLKKGNTNYLFILTFTLIAASQFEVATLLFIPLAILSIIILKIKLPRKLIFICFALFIFSQLSLLVFDLRHNFINTKYLVNYFTRSGPERIRENIPLTGLRAVYFSHNLLPNTLARTIIPSGTGNVAIEYANCPQYLSFKHKLVNPVLRIIIWGVLFIFSFIVISKKGKKSADSVVIERTILVYVVLIVGGSSIYTYIFQGEMAEYYFLTLFSYFFLIIGILLGSVKSKIGNLVTGIMLIIIAAINTNQIFSSFNPYGLTNKEKALEFATSKIGSNPFIIDSFQTCWYSGGYRYLFTFFGREPQTSYMDQYLNEYYTSDSITQPSYEVTILTPELIGENPFGYEDYRNKVISTADTWAKFGAIEVYINKI